MATKAFKRLKTDESKQELGAIQKIAECELYKLKTKAWDDWCEKLSTMKANRLLSEISKVEGSTKQVTTRNPKEEADTLAKRFATRAASHTLPLRIQQELRDRHEERSSALQEAIQIESNTDRPFSISWHQGTLPAQWKKAKVIPIPKPGGSSYRPISLLQNISKIMEKMVANRLTWLLPTQQNLFGFVRGKSTTDAIAQVIGDITKGKKANGNNRTTVATFLDLDKAFERAQPLAILDSLITLGFKGKILAWLKDYLSNRSIVVALQGFNSTQHPTDTGLPWGSILGPILFNALVIIILKQTVTIGTKLHPDDLVLISKGRDPFGRMQHALHRPTAPAESLGLFFSASKTKTMLFYCIPEDIRRFTIGEQPVELVKTHSNLFHKLKRWWCPIRYGINISNEDYNLVFEAASTTSEIGEIQYGSKRRRLPTPPNSSVPRTPTSPNSSVPRTPTPPNSSVPRIPTPPNSSVPRTPTPPNSSVPRTPTPPNSPVPRTPTPPNSSVLRIPTPPNSSVPRTPTPPNSSVSWTPTPPNSSVVGIFVVHNLDDQVSVVDVQHSLFVDDPGSFVNPDQHNESSMPNEVPTPCHMTDDDVPVKSDKFLMK
ncbi:hypothetical protein LSH36_193g11036 [Paralvinella palmiformis]|uniref:Reverse transcriptase domain-containing protein n=1 Tax=Paralvinella palmiformis TaxID=53620 RepID=A0AAD9JQK6_9ANNE|nr:hypothetical protein LSH36_193g11036 [Paralvinella palmiformis]